MAEIAGRARRIIPRDEARRLAPRSRRFQEKQQRRIHPTVERVDMRGGAEASGDAAAMGLEWRNGRTVQ